MRSLRLLLLLLLAGASALHAATFKGVVTHVTDGDTLWVRPDGERDTVEIRLADIDAPEGCQPFGPQAKKALAARVLRQPVVVRTRGRDDYDRAVAVVRHRKQDINAWLVREGHAWATGYGRKVGPYERQEDQARAARRGLWSGPGPIEPRTFRRRHGRCV
jgi:endonuclease YncB( thermonuclease family)